MVNIMINYHHSPSIIINPVLIPIIDEEMAPPNDLTVILSIRECHMVLQMLLQRTQGQLLSVLSSHLWIVEIVYLNNRGMIKNH